MSRTTRCANPQVTVTAKWERNGFCDARLANLGSASLQHAIFHGQRWNGKQFRSIIGKGSRRTSICRPPQSNYFLIRIELLTRNVASSSSLVFNQFRTCSFPCPWDTTSFGCDEHTSGMPPINPGGILWWWTTFRILSRASAYQEETKHQPEPASHSITGVMA